MVLIFTNTLCYREFWNIHYYCNIMLVGISERTKCTGCYKICAISGPIRLSYWMEIFSPRSHVLVPKTLFEKEVHFLRCLINLAISDLCHSTGSLDSMRIAISCEINSVLFWSWWIHKSKVLERNGSMARLVFGSRILESAWGESRKSFFLWKKRVLQLCSANWKLKFGIAKTLLAFF